MTGLTQVDTVMVPTSREGDPIARAAQPCLAWFNSPEANNMPQCHRSSKTPAQDRQRIDAASTVGR